MLDDRQRVSVSLTFVIDGQQSDQSSASLIMSRVTNSIIESPYALPDLECISAHIFTLSDSDDE